jgi:cytoskeletal protein RodZ
MLRNFYLLQSKLPDNRSNANNMRTIGNVLRNARVEKKISLDKLERRTKIKRAFLQAIENEDWNSLPDYSVVVGFVKSIANSLSLEENKVSAVLRRDYPPKAVTINPKPDVSKRFIWSPRLTFLLGVIAVILFITGYLSYQYLRFVSPPSLDVSLPVELQQVSQDTIKVQGTTDTDATITVNNQPAIVDEDGNFSVDLAVSKDTNQITIVAKSRSGKVTTVVRRVKVE